MSGKSGTNTSNHGQIHRKSSEVLKSTFHIKEAYSRVIPSEGRVMYTSFSIFGELGQVK